MRETDFWTLLYRYFCFGWLFKDIGGDLFERAAALRYNREQARWLPTYLMRWLWWGLAFWTLGSVAEWILEADLLSMFFYAAGALSVPFAVAIAAAWIAVRGARGPT